jgi:hypothetical protein
VVAGYLGSLGLMNAIELVLYAIVAPLPLLLGLTSAIWPERIVAMCQSLRQNGSWFSGGALYATPRRARLTGIALCLIGVICLAPFTDAIFHS